MRWLVDDAHSDDIVAHFEPHVADAYQTVFNWGYMPALAGGVLRTPMFCAVCLYNESIDAEVRVNTFSEARPGGSTKALAGLGIFTLRCNSDHISTMSSDRVHVCPCAAPVTSTPTCTHETLMSLAEWWTRVASGYYGIEPKLHLVPTLQTYGVMHA